jgi:competence protein ComEC
MGFAKVTLSFFVPTLSGLLGTCVTHLANALILLVKAIARLDLNCILIGRVGIGAVLLYYGLVLFASFARTRHVVLKKWLCVVCGLMLIGYLGAVKWQRTRRDHLILSCLDVGHGQAILVQLPGTMNVLFDAGSLYHDDVGTRIVGPFLDYLGVGRLHAVVVSHHDLDHINGIPEIVDYRQTNRVYVNEASFPQAQRAETAELLVQHLRTRHQSVEPIPQTLSTGRTQIHVLWPPAEAALAELSDNDKALVCLLEFAGRKVLLCSDVERPAQQEISKRHPDLKADVVVVPHHGSLRTLDERSLKGLGASVLVCSCSRTDQQRGRVVARVQGAELLVTATDGAVTVCIDKAGVIKSSTSCVRHDE